MESKTPLSRLLYPEQIETLLQDFGALLGPEVSLAVSDETDQILGNHRAFPTQVAHALRQVASTKSAANNHARENVYITPDGAIMPINVQAQQTGFVLATGLLPNPARTQVIITALGNALESLAKSALEKRSIARETLDRYRELNLLYNLGEALATCLNVKDILKQVLTEASRIIHANRGAILLYDETDTLMIGASAKLTDAWKAAITERQALIEEVIHAGKPQIIEDFDVPTNGEEHKPLLAVPLRTSERPLGVILLADKAGGAMFTAGDEKLVSALAWQATISLENARLFENVQQQRDEIARMKRYMDDIFDSITSGVITINNRDIITTYNRAAEMMLLIPTRQAIGRPYYEVLRFLQSTDMPALIEDVRRHHRTHVDQEICAYLPHGALLHLSVSLSTLRRSEGEVLGVAIVLDDVTEKRQYEQERMLLSRYLPHGLVDRLPHDLAELEMRGERRLITALFADIRGFTGLSEANPPEQVMEVLNNYLTLAEAAIRFNQGIVDKYIGDATMALFNTPLLETEDHAWRAIQAAWALKKAVESYHHDIPPNERLFLGIGVCTGEAVVGNVGAADRLEYTAIGDTINLAKRLQENSQPGQILINHETWERVRDRVQVNPLPVVRLKGRQAFTHIYEVTGITEKN